MKKMSTNGVNGVASHQSVLSRFGLVKCSDGKYLTAETFGHKINATGANLRKKQVWSLEQDPKEGVVYLKSHLGCYLSSDRHGNVACDSEEWGPNEKFVIEYCKTDSSKWAFKSVAHQYYFGGKGDKLECHDNNPGDENWWFVHLGIHPQVNFVNVLRARFAHMHDDQIQVTEVIPWGQDALITIEYHNGKYAVKTCDNRYLHRGGDLSSELTNDCLFTIEMAKSGTSSGIALKDCTGAYISAIGATATMKAGKAKVPSKDELFHIEDNFPQVTLIAHNGKHVSIKQGVDVSANQEEVTDKETFQLEYKCGPEGGRWMVRTIDNKLWQLGDANGIQANGTKETSETLFEMEYQESGKIALKAVNGKYITARKNGSLYAVADAASETEVYKMEIANRPILVLKSEHGFVGFKGPKSTRLDCNKTVYDVCKLTCQDDGSYSFQAPNGNDWSVSSDGTIVAESGQTEGFFIELLDHIHCKIRTRGGNYLKGEQNGTFVAKSSDASLATKWEY